MTIVVSKLGTHCTGPHRDGFRPYLETLKSVGRRPAVVDCHGDFGSGYEAIEIDPTTLTIGTLVDSDAYFDINELRRVAALNPHIKYWQVYNEINGDWVGQANRLIEIMNLYGDEFKFVIFNCAEGTPQYPEIDPVPYAQVARACAVAKAGGHMLGLHEYGDTAETDILFRYRRLAEYLREHDALCPIVITEAGPSKGSWVGDEAFMAWCEVYDAELMKDAYIVAAALWSLGGVGWGGVNFETALPELSAYMATVEPVDVEPPIEAESYSGKFASYDPILIDESDQAWSLNGPRNPDAGYRVMRDNVQYGGGYAESLLYWQGVVYCTNQAAQWYKATADSWEQVAGDPRKMIVPEPPPVVDDVLLKVPWVGQNTARTDDDYSNSDCGPAAVAAWLRYRGVMVSVDDVSRATGKPPGFSYTVFADLDKAANVYGLNLRHMFGTVTLEGLHAEIDAGRPAIVLVHYPSLPERWDLGYTSSHWITIVGYSFDGYYYHDSYWPTEAGGKFIPISNVELSTALQNVTLNKNTARQGAFENVTLPPPVSTPMRGLHLRADGGNEGADFACLHVAKLNAAKLMTNTSFDDLQRLITEGIAPERIVLRLFAAGDNPSLKSAALFFDEQRAWLSEFNARGGRYVEIHNEPNLVQEGLGYAWHDGAEFGAWYNAVAFLIRGAFPLLKLGWPGLSPQPNAPDFMAAMSASIALRRVDWVGAHSYWQNLAGMNSNEDGRWYRRLINYGRPVIITEFSNMGVEDSDTVKGRQYKNYYASLEVGVIGAFAFISSASDPFFTARRETWARNGNLSDIPVEVGA